MIEHLDLWAVRQRGDKTGFGRELLSLGCRTYKRRSDAIASARALSTRGVIYEAVRARIIAVWR